MLVFHFHRDKYKPKRLELVGKSKWNAQFPFGNSVSEFWTTFQEIPFSPEIARLGRANLSSIYIPIEISGFWGVNGKEPSSVIGHPRENREKLFSGLYPARKSINVECRGLEAYLGET